MIDVPVPPWQVVIPGVVLWDVLVVWVAWRLMSRPEKRHRFKGPSLPKRPRKPKVVRVYRDI